MPFHINRTGPLAHGASRFVFATAVGVGALTICCATAVTHSILIGLLLGIAGGALSVVTGIPILRRSAWRAESAWMAVLNAAEVGTYEVNLSTGKIITSQRWNTMFGFRADNSPVDEQQFFARIHEEDRKTFHEALQAHLAGNTACFACDFRLLRGDGILQWVQTRAQVIEWDKAGRALRVVGISIDTDKQHRAEEMQKNMNEFLLSTLSSLPSHLAVLDRDGTIVLTNSSWKHFHDEPGTLAQRPSTGENFFRMLEGIRGADAPTARAIRDAAQDLFNGKPVDVSVEYDTLHAGVRRTFQVGLMRFELMDGPRVTVAHREITALRNAQRKVRDSEERWQFAIDGSGDAIWDWDLISGTSYRSARFFKMLGLDAAAIAEDFDYIRELAHPDDLPLIEQKHGGLIEGHYDVCAFEHRLRHKDGSWRWILARCTVNGRDANNRATRVLGVHTDISALKQVEAQLRARESDNRLLGLVAEHTTNSVVICDAQGQVRWANRGFETMTGYSLQEAIGRKPGELLQGPDTAQATVEFMRLNLSAGKALRTKILNYRKDKRPYWVSIEIQPVCGSDGGVRHFVAVMEDVTERERLEVERRLSQKLESVGQLAAGMAHEINTPVQFVGDSITFIDEAWREIEPLIQAWRRPAALSGAGSAADRPQFKDEDLEFLLGNLPRAIARAQHGVQRVGGIVRAMKEFAHPDRGEYADADVNQALRNTLIVAKSEYKYVGDANAQCGELPAVRCRISAVNQVLLNLIVNAAHALADRNHSPETGRIDVKTRREDDMIVVTVADNGCGIPENIRERIFDPFFTSKEVGRGTGQGLAIARTIVVEQHGGRITVESKVGVGSTFEVWLPIAGPEETTHELPEIEELSPQSDVNSALALAQAV